MTLFAQTHLHASTKSTGKSCQTFISPGNLAGYWSCHTFGTGKQIQLAFDLTFLPKWENAWIEQYDSITETKRRTCIWILRPIFKWIQRARLYKQEGKFEQQEQRQALQQLCFSDIIFVCAVHVKKKLQHDLWTLTVLGYDKNFLCEMIELPLLKWYDKTSSVNNMRKLLQIWKCSKRCLCYDKTLFFPWIIITVTYCVGFLMFDMSNPKSKGFL